LTPFSGYRGWRVMRAVAMAFGVVKARGKTEAEEEGVLI
jgi:hypothetical protein